MDPALEEVVKRIVAHFNPEKIFLFGSRAQGSDVSASDYDLLVVMNELSEPGYRYSQKAHEILWGIRCSKDVFFTSVERFEQLKNSVGSLSELVHRDGRELYASAA